MVDVEVLGFEQLKKYYKDDHNFASEFPKPSKDYVEQDGYLLRVTICVFLRVVFVNCW